MNVDELPELPDPADADPVEAVEVCREALAAGEVPAVDYSLAVVLADYDRRGAELEQLRAIEDGSSSPDASTGARIPSTSDTGRTVPATAVGAPANEALTTSRAIGDAVNARKRAANNARRTSA